MTYHAWYDTETTGPEPTYDQILQAAGILTDDDFQEMETIDVRCRLAGHIIPTAGALKVTHVNPYEISRAKYSFYEFALLIHDTFKSWGSRGETAYAGYNTIRYDEEIMRQMFYQNLLDPYITSGKGRMRTDYLTTMRCLHARNPEVIEFPIIEETGKKSFKLERIAPANGFTGHDAHDALGDVRATIFAARLIRDTDLALYEHMLRMGNANTAKDFADNERMFQMLGGPMLNPGVLDVFLIGSEKTNPKNKSAWNLAIDPLPYLDMSPEQILKEMQKPGTPFRTVKCNKQPGIFPMNWGFLNRVQTEDFAPADAMTIDERAEMIRSHDGFQQAVSDALGLRSESYDAPVHLEEKIYAGFASWDDKDLMQAFHTAPDWDARLEISRQIEKDECRALGLRTVYLNSPQSVSEHMRDQIDQRLIRDRFTLETDRPWNTVGKLMQELDEMLEETPDDEELLNIRKWALETYPIAHNWEAYKAEQARKAEEAANPQPPEAGDEAPVEQALVAEPEPVSAVPVTAAVTVPQMAAHYLDGLEE